MQFDYQLKRDIEKPSKESINIIRVLGLFFTISGLVSLQGRIDEEINFKTILFAFNIFIGLVQMFFPVLASKIIIYDEYIKIDGSQISWKLHKKTPETALPLNSIKQIEVLSGAVQFEIVNGEKYMLNSHKMRSKIKFEEFNSVIRKLQSEVNK